MVPIGKDQVSKPPLAVMLVFILDQESTSISNPHLCLDAVVTRTCIIQEIGSIPSGTDVCLGRTEVVRRSGDSPSVA